MVPGFHLHFKLVNSMHLNLLILQRAWDLIWVLFHLIYRYEKYKYHDIRLYGFVFCNMGFGLKAWNQLVRTQETWETRDKASSLWNIQEPCQILVLLSKAFSSQEKKVFKIASAFYLSFTSDTKVFQLIVNMCLKHRSPSYLKKHDTCLFLQRVGTFYCRIRIFKKSGST